jgi:hypothetical protein
VCVCGSLWIILWIESAVFSDLNCHLEEVKKTKNNDSVVCRPVAK